MKVKTGDKVRITAGKDKGKIGKVIQTFPLDQKVVVEGVNQSIKHIKRRGDQAGQRVEFTGPVHVSNVRVVGEAGDGRVGYKFLDREGKKKKIRVLKTRKGTEDLE